MTYFITFFAELFKRFFSEKPWFFKWVQGVSAAVAFITGLPTLLASSGIVLPEAWNAISSQIISVAAIVAAFIAQLTVTTKVKEDEHLRD